MEEIFIINSYNRSLNGVLGEGVKLKKNMIESSV